MARLTPLEDANFRLRTPYDRFEDQDVTFSATTAADTEITHTLPVTEPANVHWEVLEWNFTATPTTIPVVWRNTSTDARTWGVNYIILRCNIASASARVRVYLSR